MSSTPNPLLTEGSLSVINIGADLFAEALKAQAVPVVQVQWTPPADRDDDLMSLLDDLI